MMRTIALLLTVATTLGWAGQSLTTGPVTNSSFPTRSKTLPYRVEYYLHDWPANPEGGVRPFRSDALGFDSYVTPVPGAGTYLIIQSLADTGGSTFNIPLSLFPNKRLYLRFQRDPDNKQYSCEAWDENGVRIFNATSNFTGFSTTTGSGAEASGKAGAVAFVRVHSTLVGLNSRPPVHFDPNDRLLEWKFDGNRNDSSGNGYNATGSANYTATVDQKVYSIIKANATSWSNWTSLRAGVPQTLNGLSSYSQADDSADVTYEWSWKSGPQPVIFDDPKVATPVVSGLVFGTHTFTLKVVGTNGLTSNTELQVGAVATDDQGVVIPANPDVEKLFGPMIAFGKNPWQFADDAHLRGMKIRSKVYDNISPPSWASNLPGKVSFNANVATPKGTLAAPVTASANTITLNGGHSLDLSSVPTVISFGIPGQGGEEVLISSVAGNVLTVAYDGRGWMNSNPRSWQAGQGIYQNKAAGTGTRFLTDFCPAGLGPEGQVKYRAGTVTIAPGSNVLQGTGTTWTTEAGVYSYMWVRIQGSYGNGLPFVFISPIASIGGPTAMTLARNYPATADATGNMTYQIIAPMQRFFAPHWVRPDGSDGQAVYFGQGSCLSDTVLHFSSGYEVYTGTQTAQNYSYMSDYWMTSGGNGTPNFYDEVLANYALYYRSGYQPALDAARKLGDYWLKQPLIDEGWTGSFPRNMSIGGTVAGAALDGRVNNWYALRRLAASGVRAISNSCDDDVREVAYQLMWLAFAAQFDPLDTGNPAEPGQRSYWKAKLADAYTRDLNCKGTDNSFSSASYFNFFGPTGNVVKGSTAVTGSGYSPGMCPRTAGGTGTVTANLETLTATSTIPAGASTILITGTREGKPFEAKFQYLGSGATVQLNALWPGDSGVVKWQTESEENVVSWSPNDPSSPEYGKTYGCTYNSPTSITLSRPWEGNTGVAYYSKSNLLGKGQQPFIAGIKVLQMKFASQAATGQTATDYTALTAQLANWIRDTGFDPETGGLFYGRGFLMCEPVFKASRPGFSYRNVNCSFGLGKDDKGAARALLAEAQNAVRVVYETDPSPANRDFGDTAYSNQWGMQGFTDSAVPLSESNIFNIYASDQSLGAGKWYGFQFGVGMAHQWPAVRLGGSRPLNLEDMVIDYNVGAFPNATGAVIRVLQPNGAISDYACSAENCVIQIDRRQGSPWYRLFYRDASDAIVATGEWQLLQIP